MSLNVITRQLYRGLLKNYPKHPKYHTETTI